MQHRRERPTSFKDKFKNKISVVNKNGTHTKIVGGETMDQHTAPPTVNQPRQYGRINKARKISPKLQKESHEKNIREDRKYTASALKDLISDNDSTNKFVHRSKRLINVNNSDNSLKENENVHPPRRRSAKRRAKSSLRNGPVHHHKIVAKKTTKRAPLIKRYKTPIGRSSRPSRQSSASSQNSYRKIHSTEQPQPSNHHQSHLQSKNDEFKQEVYLKQEYKVQAQPIQNEIYEDDQYHMNVQHQQHVDEHEYYSNYNREYRNNTDHNPNVERSSGYSKQHRISKKKSSDSPPRESHEILHSNQGSYSKQYRRKRDFKPYTLEDFKNQQLKNNMYKNLGGLGPDLQNPELEKKRARKERMKAYAAQVKQENHNLPQQSHQPTPLQLEKMKKKKKKALSKREKMKQFSKRVKPPKKRKIELKEEEHKKTTKQPPVRQDMPKVVNYIESDDEEDFFGDEQASDDEMNSMEADEHELDELERLEMLHQQDAEWVASLQH